MVVTSKQANSTSE